MNDNTPYVPPCNLPPTSTAAQYHSLRVYHQVQQWSGNDLPPEDWGWILTDGKLVPMSTNLQPAPAYLLDAIHCNCKGECNTRRCGCRKHRLDCSLACGECESIHCSNVTHPDIEIESDDEIDKESET